jgi:hypothetical protein
VPQLRHLDVFDVIAELAVMQRDEAALEEAIPDLDAEVRLPIGGAAIL